MIKASKLRKSRRLQRRRRHARIRKKVHGTGERPRLAVYRSLRNIEGQVIDDDRHHTLVGLSTLAPELQDGAAPEAGGKIEAARAAGRLLAERARDRGVTTQAMRGPHRRGDDCLIARSTQLSCAGSARSWLHCDTAAQRGLGARKGLPPTRGRAHPQALWRAPAGS